MEDEIYKFSSEDTYAIFDLLKESSKILCECPTEDLVKIFEEFYSHEDGEYTVDMMEALNKIIDRIISNTLMDLVQDGSINMSFDSDKNDFVFFLEDDGQKWIV